MSDYQRIKKVMEITKMATLTEFAKEIEAGAQILYNIKRGVNGISKNLADKINARFPQFSVSWLLTGEGEISEVKEPLSDTNKDQLIDSLNKRIEELKYTIELQKGIINSQRSYMKLNDGTDARPTIQNRLEKLSALIVALEEMMMLNQRLITEQEKIMDDEK